METLQEHRSSYMPSSRQSRMAIDSLLNPPESTRSPTTPPSFTNSPGSLIIKTDQPSPRLQYAPPPQYSPLYPPSPNHYFYSPYSDSTHHLPPYRESYRESYRDSAHDHHHHHHHQSAFLPYRPRSTESSPGAYSRDRYDSVSSSSSNAAAERRRPPRPKYEEEEMYFIWYHRVDLCQEWKEVRESFNRQFPDRQRRGFQGIQCKFYRFIKEKKCPTLREQRRMRDGEFLREGSGLVDSGGSQPRFGVVEWMGVWYPWMREGQDQVPPGRISA